MKRELRERRIRDALSLPIEYRTAADARICRFVLDSGLFSTAQTILCYAGTNREIDTMPLLQGTLSAGKRLCLPLCTGSGVMEARCITSLSQLSVGRYGILAPEPSGVRVLPEELDLVIVPCCTGNGKGQRLGYGGGYYDRYLPQTHCPTLRLCRSRLLTDPIPMDAHDVLMDYLVTEYGMTACERRG